MHRIADLADKDFVADQYRTAGNLNARITLHQRFSTNQYGWQRWVFDRLHLPAEARILELACGVGDLWLENESRIPAGWHVTLSDLSPGMVEQARQRLEPLRHPIRFEVIDAQSIPFDSQGFDGVIANHMLYHVPDRDRALAEISRILEPAGRFYASTVGQAHLREIADLVTRFAPGLSMWGERPTDSFTLENGAAQLERWFGEVTLTRYEDALLVTEPDALVDYILSGKMELSGDEREAFPAFVGEELQRAGSTFYVTKDSGMFECRAPRSACVETR